MSSLGSVTVNISGLKRGDPEAAQNVWEGYFLRLVGLARHKLLGAPRVACDEEDVALSAFASFCRAAAEGRFPRLDDRDDLWQLLLMITVRKAANLRKYERRQKRGGGKVVVASDLAEDRDEEPEPFAALMSREPTPELAALVADEVRRRLGQLGDEGLRAIAQWKMEGYTNAEIAQRIGRSEVTVERKLNLIRSRWKAAEDD